MNESKIPNHVLHVRFTGKLTANEVNAYRSTLEAKMKEQSHIGMVVDLAELSDISAEGLSAGIQADMALLSNIDQFYRIALVSDKEWPGVLIDLIQSLISKPEFKVFASSQRNAALEWAAKLPITEVKSMREPSMQKVERYAVVGAPSWMQKLIEVMSPMFPDIDMRSFSADKETQAWQWLKAKAVE